MKLKINYPNTLPVQIQYRIDNVVLTGSFFDYNIIEKH